MKKHPNTLAAGSTGLVAGLIVWLLSLAGIQLSNGEAMAAAGVAISVVLYVGRRGLLGTLNDIWYGHK